MKHASVTTEKIVAALRERGYRVTSPRKKIIAALLNARHPITAISLSKRVEADTVSVYRTLALLQEEDFIEIIETGQSVPRYAYKGEHHHHIVCSTCGRVAHVPCQGVISPKKQPGFSSVTHHEVTYYARCDSCT